LLDLESKAVVDSVPSLITRIYAPDARVWRFRGDTLSAEQHYNDKFAKEHWITATHNRITDVRIYATTASLASGDTIHWIDKVQRLDCAYDNPAGSDIWTFTRSPSGCWRIESLEFAARGKDGIGGCKRLVEGP
jgi:hypothetical protein